MTTLDWMIVAVLAVGTVMGFMKGFIRQLASIVGLIAGLLVARALFISVGDRFAEHLDTSLTFARVMAFILIWVLVPLVFLMLASACTQVVNKIGLGMVNRLLGAGLGTAKYVLLVGMAIHFIEFIDSKNNLIGQAVKQSSVLYYPVEEFSGMFYPTVKEVTKQIID